MKKIILSLAIITSSLTLISATSIYEVKNKKTETLVYNCLDDVYDLAVHLHPDDEAQQLATFIKAYKYLCAE